ncbi:MAG: CCA tRNA nucleotidyltransferase [Desulfonatronovibrionaceae bacterium]
MSGRKLQKALELVKIIQDRGYSALVAGGAVRDTLLKRRIMDVDLATDMPLSWLGQEFYGRNIGRSRDFGIMSIEYLGQRYEVSALAGDSREMENISDRYRCDAGRRDFTINSMAMDWTGDILDPFGGQADLGNRLIRATLDPDQRFTEDPLRLLRAVRLAVELDFRVEKQTGQSMLRLGPLLAQMPGERIGHEVIRMFSQSGSQGARAVRLMGRFGLLEIVLPEIQALEGLPHDPEHHPEGGVLKHTLAALEAGNSSDPAVNLAILFHDAGKADTLVMQGSSPRYFRHDQAGIQPVERACRRLKLQEGIRQGMEFAAASHMQALAIKEMRPSRVYRFLSHPCWQVLKKVVLADLAARGGQEAARFEQHLQQAQSRVSAWLDKNQKKQPVISGRQVMELTGLGQGPLIGRIISRTTEWAMDNNVQDQKRIRDYVLKLAESGSPKK